MGKNFACDRTFFGNSNSQKNPKFFACDRSLKREFGRTSKGIPGPKHAGHVEVLQLLHRLCRLFIVTGSRTNSPSLGSSFALVCFRVRAFQNSQESGAFGPKPENTLLPKECLSGWFCSHRLRFYFLHSQSCDCQQM